MTRKEFLQIAGIIFFFVAIIVAFGAADALARERNVERCKARAAFLQRHNIDITWQEVQAGMDKYVKIEEKR